MLAKSNLLLSYCYPHVEALLLVGYRGMKERAPCMGALWAKHIWEHAIINDADYR
jgi:hypothetical protein